jgi:hypothetical protein
MKNLKNQGGRNYMKGIHSNNNFKKKELKNMNKMLKKH